MSGLGGLIMLADKEHLNEWIEAGKQNMREDAIPVDALLRLLSDSLLHDNIIKKSNIIMGEDEVDGFTFDVYQPFYKSCPLGMVLDMEIIIDGETVPREDIYLILKGSQRIRLLEARTIQDIWWNIVDPLIIFIPRKGGLPAGDHELEFTLAELISEYYEFPKDLIMGHVKTTMHVA